MIFPTGTEKVSGHCPSCDVLFDSVAQAFNADKLDGHDSSDFLLGLGELE